MSASRHSWALLVKHEGPRHTICDMTYTCKYCKKERVWGLSCSRHSHFTSILIFAIMISITYATVLTLVYSANMNARKLSRPSVLVLAMLWVDDGDCHLHASFFIIRDLLNLVA